MRITRVELKDFRCFEEFQIAFSEEHNTHVLIAENMVGKSALMAALRLATNTYTSGLKVEKQLLANDHRILGSNPISDIAPSVEITVSALLSDGNGTASLSTWRKYKNKPKGEKTKVEILGGEDPRLFSKKTNRLASAQKAIQPLLSFIGTEYIHAESSDTVDWEVTGKSIDGYKGCFEDKSIKKYLFKWLGRMDGLVAEMDRKPLIAEAYQDVPRHALAVFQEAVRSILPDVLEIDWSDDLKEPIVKLANQSIRPFGVLSDGYRYLILLAGELATRAFILNKHLGTQVLQHVHGLVLIDEFGIHLHPSLQNDTLIRLQKTFPKVQFIVSTHSPLLINGLSREQVHVLVNEEGGRKGSHHPEEDVIGLGANEILTKIFGLPTTMDKAFVNKNHEYAELFAQKKAKALDPRDEERFRALASELAPLRLDPELKLVQDDPITALVKERLAQRIKARSPLEPTEITEDLSRQVDEILGAIFSEKASKAVGIIIDKIIGGVESKVNALSIDWDQR